MFESAHLHGKTDNQSLIKNKHDSERTVWGCVYFIISVCPELLRGTGVPSRFCFSEIHLHLRVRERALMVATPTFHLSPANLVHSLQTILPILTEISSF